MNPILEKIIYLRGMAKSMGKKKAKAVNDFADKLSHQHDFDNIPLDLEFDQSESSGQDCADLFEMYHFQSWRLGLATLMCRHFSCSLMETSIWHPDYHNKKIFRYRLVGRRRDMNLLRVSFFKMSKDIEKMSNHLFKDKKRQIQSYCGGMTETVRLTLTNMKNAIRSDAKTAGKLVDVAFLESRAGRAEKATKAIFRHSEVTKVKRDFDFDQVAFEQGVRDGEKLFHDKRLTATLKNIMR